MMIKCEQLYHICVIFLLQTCVEAAMEMQVIFGVIRTYYLGGVKKADCSGKLIR